MTEDLSLEALSKEFFLDRSYISRLFRKKLGISYVEFISAQRVSSACEMLSKTSKSITEIAYDCGFRNQSSFNRVFLAQRGMTPTEYRKNSCEMRDAMMPSLFLLKCLTNFLFGCIIQVRKSKNETYFRKETHV